MVKKFPPLAGLYIVLGIVCLARAYTFHATDWSESPHVGILLQLPDTAAIGLWLVAGVALLGAYWFDSLKIVGVPLAALLNFLVGVASLWNRFNGVSGVTLSIAVSYVAIAFITLLLPRLTDKQTVTRRKREE